jgi:hypothetical protein
VFDYYARLLTAADNPKMAADARQKAEQHRKAAQAQWTGQWLRRAWLGPTLGWLGESTLWVEPQPWAIIGGVTTPEQTRALVRTMDENLRRLSPIGAMQMGKGPDSEHVAIEPGTSINGGIWPSLNQTLIWALSLVDGRMAWDEWAKNSLARHAEIYPNVWYQTWSGPDCINSTLSHTPGETVNSGFLRYTDFPVMNLHSHACSIYGLVKLLGVEFTEKGLRLRPAIPLDSYRFESALLGVRKSPEGYEGWYAPSRAGTWEIRVRLQEHEAAAVMKAQINGRTTEIARSEDGSLALSGESSAGRPLRWALRRA